MKLFLENKEFIPEIALIMRDDDLLKENNFKRVTIPTSFGPVDRCFIGYIYNVPVLIVYGRFNGEKSPSSEINHQQTIEAIKNSGAKKVIGTFVVGGIKKEYNQGTVFIVDDFIGMGNYKIHWDYNRSFHNAEMIQPFCKELKKQLEEASTSVSFPVVKNAIYVCFNGYPRIETRAEIRFYESLGADCVGQTLDPEATVCRLNGLCYAALCVQVDDPIERVDYANSLETSKDKPAYKKSLKDCRKHTSQIVVNFLKNYKIFDCDVCCSLIRTNKNFREFPDWFYGE